MATFILSVIILVLAGIAVRKVYKRKGRCCGCSGGCSGCHKSPASGEEEV